MKYVQLAIVLLYFLWPVALLCITILWLKPSWRALALRCSVGALLAAPLGWWWFTDTEDFRPIHAGALFSAVTFLLLGHQLMRKAWQGWGRLRVWVASR